MIQQKSPEDTYPARREAMASASLTDVYTMQGIADYFRVPCATDSRALRWIESGGHGPPYRLNQHRLQMPDYKTT